MDTTVAITRFQATLEQQILLAGSDPAVEAEIERLAARLAAYAAPERPAERPAGLIQLRKKTEGGMVSVGG